MFRSIFLLAFTAAALADAPWNQFRGPRGDGTSTETGLADTLGENTNVKWKTPLHGKAWSSPVVWEDKVWLTTANEAGTELGVFCVDAATGKILRDERLFTVANPQFCHKFNSYASPTPVVEKGRLYVSFGSPGIAALDTETGKVLWERRDFVCNHFRGSGSSPIVFENLLITHFDGSDRQYVVALDKTTGRTVWETPRSVDYMDLQPDGKPEADGDWRKAYATPHIYLEKGQPVMLSSGAKAHYAYDPRTGREIWRFEDRGCHSAGSRPIVASGLVFINTGFGKSAILALRLGGHGLLTEKQLAWKATKGQPNKPGLIVTDGLVFAMKDDGVAYCFDAATGAPQWSERIGGNYSASPLLADGRIYVASEEGKVTTIAPARTFQKFAEGKFDDGFMASPAVAGKAMYWRSKTALYRVEK
jgi:outer membrane protein assembly factor BamB